MRARKARKANREPRSLIMIYWQQQLRFLRYFVALLALLPQLVHGLSLDYGSVTAGANYAASSSFSARLCLSSGLSGMSQSQSFGLTVGCSSVMPAESRSGNLGLQAAGGSVTVSWEARAGNVERYEITNTQTGEVCRTDELSCTFSGLSTGAFTFTVTTIFSDGSRSVSTQSGSVSVTSEPSAPPLPVPLPMWLVAFLAAGLILSVTGRRRPVRDRFFQT